MAAFSVLSGAPRKMLRALLILGAALLTIPLGACAGMQKMYRFHPSSITKISYDPRSCMQLPDGRYLCKNVVFTVASIDAATPK